MPKTQSLKNLSEKDILSLLARCEAAIQTDSVLQASDVKLLIEIAQGYFHIQERLANKDLTLTRLRKLLGIESASEKSKDIFPGRNNDSKKDSTADGTDTTAGNASETSTTDNGESKGHGKSGVADYEKADVCCLYSRTSGP